MCCALEVDRGVAQCNTPSGETFPSFYVNFLEMTYILSVYCLTERGGKFVVFFKERPKKRPSHNLSKLVYSTYKLSMFAVDAIYGSQLNNLSYFCH